MALDPRPDHILIETSGLALPKPLLKAFDWPDIRSRITVDGVIAVADAEAVAAGRFAPDVGARRRPAAGRRQPRPRDAALRGVRGPDLLRRHRAADQARPRRTRGRGEGARGDRGRGAATAAGGRGRRGRVDPRVILGLGAAAEDDIARAAVAPRRRRGARPRGFRQRRDRRSRLCRSRRADAPDRGAGARAQHPARQGLRLGRAASRCGSWSRRWARAFAPSTTGPGVRTRSGAGGSWSSPRRAPSTRRRSARRWRAEAMRTAASDRREAAPMTTRTPAPRLRPSPRPPCPAPDAIPCRAAGCPLGAASVAHRSHGARQP